MFKHEDDYIGEEYACNCGATCSVYYRKITASSRKNARAIGKIKISESWFNPGTKQLETEETNE